MYEFEHDPSNPGRYVLTDEALKTLGLKGMANMTAASQEAADLVSDEYLQVLEQAATLTRADRLFFGVRDYLKCVFAATRDQPRPH